MSWINAKYLGGPRHDTTYRGPRDTVTVVDWVDPDATGIDRHARRHLYRLREWRGVRHPGAPWADYAFYYCYEGPWPASVVATFLYSRAIKGDAPRPIIREISRELLELRASRQWTEYPGGTKFERYLDKVRASEELAVGLIAPEDVSRYARPRDGDAWLRRVAAHFEDHPDYREAWTP